MLPIAVHKIAPGWGPSEAAFLSDSTSGVMAGFTGLRRHKKQLEPSKPRNVLWRERLDGLEHWQRDIT